MRVNGAELRCKVVAEGGNLGLTQLGRIEFAQHGGRINTDAIDNSAGVDCSDHEVNIKILLGLVVADGEMTEKQRNKLLAEMTDEVGLLVLKDNYAQPQALSIAKRYVAEMLDAEARLMRWLERAGRLKRKIEFLPTDDEITERQAAKHGLTSPERAVLLAYSKMWLYDELVDSDVPEDPLVADMLLDYFPLPLQRRYSEPMQRHPLKREILATHLTNALVNRVGCTFVHRLMEETDACPSDIVRAALMARNVFNLDDLWKQIDALDNLVADEVQARMFVEVVRLLEGSTLWFLRHLKERTNDATVAASRAAARRRSGSRRSCPCCCPPPTWRRGTRGGASWKTRASRASWPRGSRAATYRRRCSTVPKSRRIAIVRSKSSRACTSRSARCSTTNGSPNARCRCRRRPIGTCSRVPARWKNSHGSSAR